MAAEVPSSLQAYKLPSYQKDTYINIDMMYTPTNIGSNPFFPFFKHHVSLLSDRRGFGVPVGR